MELKVSYHEGAEHQCLKCQTVRVTTTLPGSGQTSTVSEWWLAESRNFLPIRLRLFAPSRSTETPQVEGEVEKLRELNPGIWFPEHAEVTSFNPLELERTGKQKLQWREQYTISKLSLAPEYGREFFQDDRIAPTELPALK